MRLFADQCVHTDLVEALRKQGFNVERASEIRLAQAHDDVIFRHAIRSSRVLLTADKDFGNIIRFNIKRSRGIVLINMDRMPREVMIRRTLDFFGRIDERRLHGTLWIVGVKGIKTWPK